MRENRNAHLDASLASACRTSDWNKPNCRAICDSLIEGAANNVQLTGPRRARSRGIAGTLDLLDRVGQFLRQNMPSRRNPTGPFSLRWQGPGRIWR
jgi:hypothetical protein